MKPVKELVAAMTLEEKCSMLSGMDFWHTQAVLLLKLHAFIQGKHPDLTAGCELAPAGLGEHVGV